VYRKLNRLIHVATALDCGDRIASRLGPGVDRDDVG